MISYITGKILKISSGKDWYVDILTNSGVGYRVYIPKTTNLITTDKETSLYTYMHVREDIQMLYGFKEESDRDFFESLISVSGVGPKTALAILSTYTRKEIEEMIAKGDSKSLSKAPGLGGKGAQKIILELRGKIDFDKVETETTVIKDLKNALKVLGFSGDILKDKVEVGEKMVKRDPDIEVEQLLKKVLAA